MDSTDTGTNSSNKQAALVQLMLLGGESKKAWDPFYTLVGPGLMWKNWAQRQSKV